MIKARLKAETFRTHVRIYYPSVRAFAREWDFSDAMLTQLLRAYRHPGPKMRQRLMDATGLTFDDLFEIMYDEGAPT